MKKQSNILRNVNRKFVLTADLGETNLRMAAIDNEGNILYRTKRATPKRQAPDQIVGAILDLSEECRQASKRFGEPLAMAVAVGGIIIDGRILRGADRIAGEIGHICVEPNGAECGCGSRGCIEQYAWATAVVRLA